MAKLEMIDVVLIIVFLFSFAINILNLFLVALTGSGRLTDSLPLIVYLGFFAYFWRSGTRIWRARSKLNKFMIGLGISVIYYGLSLLINMKYYGYHDIFQTNLLLIALFFIILIGVQFWIMLSGASSLVMWLKNRSGSKA